MITEEAARQMNNLGLALMIVTFGCIFLGPLIVFLSNRRSK